MNNKIREAFEKWNDKLSKPESYSFSIIWSDDLDMQHIAYGFHGGYTAGYAEAEKLWREKVKAFKADAIGRVFSHEYVHQMIDKILG